MSYKKIFDVLICIPMACITSSIYLLYLTKTSWWGGIMLIKENLILAILFKQCT